jgi:hypothetical protein
LSVETVNGRRQRESLLRPLNQKEVVMMGQGTVKEALRHAILLLAVAAVMVAMLVVGMGAALAQGPFEAKVPDEGSAAATPGLDKAVSAYCSHRRCG